MEYRNLGKSDLKASAITFGAWAIGGWMWGKADRKDAINAIRTSYEMGVTSIDTAPIYGQGASEEIVGEAIQGIPRDKLQILTKFGLRWDLAQGTSTNLKMRTKDNAGKEIDVFQYSRKESIILECENSLKRLKTDYIDLYQIHWADETTPISETFEAVSRLIEQGKVRHAGVCNYSVEQMEEAEKTLSLVSNQIPFSIVKRGVEEKIVPHCIKEGKSVLAYSPLQGGLLTGKMKPGQTFAEGDHRAGNPFYTDNSIADINAKLEKLKPMAADKGASLSQLIIRWTIERPGITVALVGARNSEQAIQNAKAIEIKLTSEEIQFINHTFGA